MQVPVRFWLMSLAMAGFSGFAFPQAMVEHALTSGAAATAAGSMQKVGKQAGAILDKAAKSLDTAAKPQTQTTAPAPRAAAALSVVPKAPAKEMAAVIPPAPPVTYEDPAGIKPGLEYAEMVRRFGKPSLSITGETGQTLWYETAGRSLEIEIRDGKVAKTK